MADPKSAPMHILGTLILGRTKTPSDYAGLAAAKRAIRSDDRSSIGATFKTNENKTERKIKHSCYLKG